MLLHIKKVLIIYLLFVSFNGFTQNLSHYYIGEEAFINADIYSIIQNKNSDIFVATNQGLYKGLKNTFVKIPNAPKQIGNSLFSLVEDSKGNVYGTNLSGQIFKITSEEISLYYTLSQSKSTAFSVISLAVDNKDNLIIASKECILLSPEKKVTVLLPMHHSRLGSVFKLPNNKFYLPNEGIDSIPVYQNEKITFLKNNAKSAFSESILSFFSLNNMLFAEDYNGNIASIEEQRYINLVPPKRRERLVQFSENQVYAMGRSKGLRKIILKNDTLKVAETYFKNAFISAMVQGKNGELLLGTFKEGIIVVPNRKIKVFSAKNKTIRDIVANNKDEVFTTERGVGVKKYSQKETKIIENNSIDNYHKIFVTHNYENNLTAKNRFLLFDKQYLKNGKENNPISAIKSVFEINKQSILLATADGVNLKGKLQYFSKDNWKLINKENKVYKFKKNKERCIAVAYDSLNRELLYATQKGTFSFKNNVLSEIRFKNKPLLVSQFVLHKNSIFMATSHGVLTLKNNTVVPAYTTENGLKSNKVLKISFKNNLVFILTDKNLQCVNNEDAFTINNIYGVNGYINTFSVGKDKVFVLSNNTNIASIPIAELKAKKTHDISISLQAKFKGIKSNNSSLNEFKHDQNSVSFLVDIKNVLYKQNATIHYTLKGVSSDEQTTQNNVIKFDALAYGDYHFSAYAMYGNSISNTVNYSFKILPPFWLRWWFVVLVICGFGFFVYMYVKSLLKKNEAKNRKELQYQKAKINLLDSELRSLKAQMNPHFMFNAVNSIQSLVLQDKKHVAYSYLTKFSLLLRENLKMSDKSFVFFQEEVSLLKKYLELEELRFNENFSYQIIGDEDVSRIKIPSMIIQPFVENAIKHGLLHKLTGEKKVSIYFKQTNVLTCVIVDNGVGLKKAKEINEKQRKSHTSFATDAIQNRLALLRSYYKMEIGCTYQELSQGTKVILKIPYKIQ